MKSESKESLDKELDANTNDVAEATANQEPAQTSDNPEAQEPEDAHLSKKLAQAEKQAAEHLDRFQRTLAEFDNFRKRTVKEKASMYDDGISDMASGLLPIIDNFERAFAATSEEEKSSPFFKGMQQIHKQFLQFMESKDITPIEAVGAPFDPNLHSAIAHVDDSQYGDNEVIEELQKGYMLRDKVLRHSVVKVAN